MKKRRKSGFSNFGILLAFLTILVLLAGAVYLTFYMSGKSVSVLKNGFSGDIITIQEPDIYLTETEGTTSHSFIFVGDSRTVGMASAEKAHDPSDTCRYIAKEGEGYEWLKNTGASKVVIHFDLDVIDPADMIAGVGVEPDGMKTEEVVRVINDIASEYDLVGLTIAEPMPRIAIKIRNMLNQLPLLKE